MRSSRLPAMANRFTAALIGCLALQTAFWYHTHHLRPDLEIVPPPPGQAEVQALAMGDKEFYFRVLALRMQNFGDLFGRFTSLRYYDFSRLFQWFKLLDSLDARSNMTPTVAAYYFSQTQNKPDVRYVVDYLYDHATVDVSHKWWWLLQAMYLSMHKLEDLDLTLKVSKPLLDPSVPAWAQQMVAVVHEKRGEMDDALTIIEGIQKNAKDLTDMDLLYMSYFIKERLKKLEQYEKDSGATPPKPQLPVEQ